MQANLLSALALPFKSPSPSKISLKIDFLLSHGGCTPTNPSKLSRPQFSIITLGVYAARAPSAPPGYACKQPTIVETVERDHY